LNLTIGAWWTNVGIDPTIPARALWLETHPLPTISNKTRVGGATSVINNSDLGNAGQRSRRRTPNVETNPNGKPVAFQIEANRRNARKSSRRRSIKEATK